MNPEIERQLKVTVERTVRPLRTWEQRKQVIRGEMLGHLTAIYQEEFERCGDEQGALQAARLRFGVPADLTEELQRGVPWIPGWAVWLNKRFRIDVKASPRRNAWRLTLVWFCELIFLFALCDLVVLWKGLSPWPMMTVLLPPFVLLTLVAYVALEGTFRAIAVADQKRGYWKIVRQTCWKLGGLGGAHKLLLVLQTIPTWGDFGVQEGVLVALSAVAVPGVFWFVMWGGFTEFCNALEWARLDLGEG